MELVKLEELFNIEYGNGFALNTLKLDENGINYISRTAKNNGISSKVKKMNISPFLEHTITVSLGGSVLEAFYQNEQYYTGYHMYVLTPINNMKKEEMLYYCTCIRANKYKYNYGRQANRTLKDILVPHPDEIPKHVYKIDLNQYNDINLPLINNKTPSLNPDDWVGFRYDAIFDIVRGESFYLKNLKEGSYPYVSASAQNNGITSYVSIFNQKGNAITLAYDGSIGECFYQINDFLASEKIVTIRIKEHYKKELSPYIALFLISLIKQEKFRYNYGLKWSVNSRLLKSIIKLPVDFHGNPDWNFMENYIKTLPFSKNI